MGWRAEECEGVKRSPEDWGGVRDSEMEGGLGRGAEDCRGVRWSAEEWEGVLRIAMSRGGVWRSGEECRGVGRSAEEQLARLDPETLQHQHLQYGSRCNVKT